MVLSYVLPLHATVQHLYLAIYATEQYATIYITYLLMHVLCAAATTGTAVVLASVWYTSKLLAAPTSALLLLLLRAAVCFFNADR
jgi:hypothetical protein